MQLHQFNANKNKEISIFNALKSLIFTSPSVPRSLPSLARCARFFQHSEHLEHSTRNTLLIRISERNQHLMRCVSRLSQSEPSASCGPSVLPPWHQLWPMSMQKEKCGESMEKCVKSRSVEISSVMLLSPLGVFRLCLAFWQPNGENPTSRRANMV